MKDNICHINMHNLHENCLYEKMEILWGGYDIYHIFNVTTSDVIKLYENLANTLGVVKECHPVNDKNTTISKSRDIKFEKNVPHFFASNSRQPLHTDYAYYEESSSPDWLMLYCVEPSEYGGVTDILSLDTLKEVMRKYNEKLLESIEIDVNWVYKGKDGDVVHKKPIMSENGMNWNYWQIKEEVNSPEVMRVAEEFFCFLENTIVQSRIFDFSKKWKEGDCIIFKDRKNLHGRSSFLGDRWLKDHAFFQKNKDVL